MTDSTGIAFASLVLNVATLGLLAKNRTINPTDIRELIERATLLLEEMGLDQQQTAAAHHALSQILAMIVPSAPFPK
jgi:hypothetical protein